MQPPTTTRKTCEQGSDPGGDLALLRPDQRCAPEGATQALCTARPHGAQSTGGPAAALGRARDVAGPGGGGTTPQMAQAGFRSRPLSPGDRQEGDKKGKVRAAGKGASQTRSRRGLAACLPGEHRHGTRRHQGSRHSQGQGQARRGNCAYSVGGGLVLAHTTDLRRPFLCQPCPGPQLLSASEIPRERRITVGLSPLNLRRPGTGGAVSRWPAVSSRPDGAPAQPPHARSQAESGPRQRPQPHGVTPHSALNCLGPESLSGHLSCSYRFPYLAWGPAWPDMGSGDMSLPPWHHSSFTERSPPRLCPELLQQRFTATSRWPGDRTTF